MEMVMVIRSDRLFSVCVKGSMLNHSLSGTRTSKGRGIVGLLSLRSTMITVRTAVPTNLGLPRSVAVTTSLFKETHPRLEHWDQFDPVSFFFLTPTTVLFFFFYPVFQKNSEREKTKNSFIFRERTKRTH